MSRRTAALAAVSASLLATAPAHAACEDVFSKVRQRDPLAPLVVGDSVTVPAGDFLGETGFAVDAVACRTFAQGLEVMEARRLPDLVVMALGSNADVSGAELEHALELVGPFARLVLVLPKGIDGRADRGDGQLMRAFEEAYPDQVSVLDWPAYSAGRGSWFAPDGLHITTDGARGFAELIGETLEFAPADRVDRSKSEREPERRSPPRAPRGDPAVAALWEALGRAVAAIAAPPLALLGRLVADGGDLGRQDL